MKQAIRIRENIYWVGAIDWNLRNFHGYLTPGGSSYNAYLIIDSKITLVDTVKSHLYDEMMERIASVIDPQRIDYIICNHVEMDHAGGIAQLKQQVPQAQVIASPQGAKGLIDHFKLDLQCRVVKTGDTLNTGAYTWHFTQTPMIHWPDNMVSYLAPEKILFSNDAFGQHLATQERFEDQLPVQLVMREAQKYYGNIVLNYNTIIAKALQTLSTLDISMIAPSHGVIWRRHVKAILDAYTRWSAGTTDRLALVVYDSMWNSTARMAHAIYDAFEHKGFGAKLLSLQENHISEIMTDMVTASHICVGSPTMNSQMLPTVAGFLCYLDALSPRDNRTALAFGSYGWGGQSIGLIDTALKQSKFTTLEPIRIRSVPDQAQLAQITRTVMDAL